jgi:hypothetical protein
MRNLHRALLFAVGLLVGFASSTAFAGPTVIGTFTLSRPAQWNGTTLPAGDYQFRMAPTQSDTNMLIVTGSKQTLNVLVFAHNTCESCKSVALKMTVQGDNRIITSMDLPGYHLDFKMPHAENAKETVSDSSSWVEQVNVKVDPANQ